MTRSPFPASSARRRRSMAVMAPLTALAIGLVAALPITGAGAAQAPIGLGTAGSFAVLAGSGITNTGPTTITGDVGTHPTPAITGFGTVTMTGTIHAADAVALQAKNDLTSAYNTAAAATPTTAVPTELGGRTLTPGVYGGPTLGITGALTLDALGDPDAVFVFQAGSTLITASNSSVTVLNGGTACNVFWQVGSSATLGTGSRLIGTVLAQTSISATTGATIQGRLLARTGAVTMDTNTITRPVCAPPSTTTTAPTTTTTPTPTTTPAGGAAVVPGISAPAVPGTPVDAGGGPGPSLTSGGSAGGPSGSGSTPADATNRTQRDRSPELPATGGNLDLVVAGLGAVLVGALLVGGARRATAGAGA